MKNIECLIIEDEFPASEILKGYLNEIPNWKLKASFDNAMEAIGFLASNHVDVIFVDIKLPKLSGISFIKTLKNPPTIVITSAYSEHAIEAFELTVFDYLLKPYSFERFVKTVNRISTHQAALDIPERKKEEREFILVRENRNQVKIFYTEILFLESQKEYVRIVCENKTIKTKTGISKMMEILPNEIFIRIHRSFIVKKERVDSFSKKKVSILDYSLPIGRYYQKEVNSVLDLGMKMK